MTKTSPRLPTEADDSYVLDSGEELHASFPDTFWIPDRSRRESAAPGELVKLVFRIHLASGEVEVERMWVRIEDRVGDHYLGVLDNDPFCETDLEIGRALYFLPEHIIDFYD